MAKKLSMSKVKQKAKQYEETTTITFEDDAELILYPYFSQTRISKLLKNLRDGLLGYEKYDIKVDDNLFIPLVLYYAIKEFTDAITPTKSRYKNEEDYYKADMQYFVLLMDTGYFDEITSYFIETEYQKIFDKVAEIKIANDRLEKQLKDVQDQIQNLDLQSPELKELVQKSKQIPEV